MPSKGSYLEAVISGKVGVMINNLFGGDSMQKVD